LNQSRTLKHLLLLLYSPHHTAEVFALTMDVCMHFQKKVWNWSWSSWMDATTTHQISLPFVTQFYIYNKVLKTSGQAGQADCPTVCFDGVLYNEDKNISSKF